MNHYENLLGIYKTLATCPTNTKTVGDTVTLSLNIAQGTAPYTIIHKKDGVSLPNGTYTQLSNGISSYVYTTIPGDEGTSIFSTEVIDSCITPQTWTDKCTVTIITCPTPNCNFAWSPANPTYNELTIIYPIPIQTTDVSSHKWYVDGNEVSISETFMMTPQSNHDITHEIINSCGNMCSLTKTLVIDQACTQPSCNYIMI